MILQNTRVGPSCLWNRNNRPKLRKARRSSPSVINRRLTTFTFSRLQFYYSHAILLILLTAFCTRRPRLRYVFCDSLSCSGVLAVEQRNGCVVSAALSISIASGRYWYWPCRTTYLLVRVCELWRNGWLDPDAIWGGQWGQAQYGCIRFWWWSSKGRCSLGVNTMQKWRTDLWTTRVWKVDTISLCRMYC